MLQFSHCWLPVAFNVSSLFGWSKPKRCEQYSIARPNVCLVQCEQLYQCKISSHFCKNILLTMQDVKAIYLQWTINSTWNSSLPITFSATHRYIPAFITVTFRILSVVSFFVMELCRSVKLFSFSFLYCHFSFGSGLPVSTLWNKNSLNYYLYIANQMNPDTAY